MNTVIWDKNDVHEYFTIESRQKSRSTFLKTHLSIDKIKVDFCRDSNKDSGSFISEDWFLSHLKNIKLKAENRVFFIVGDTGCGKSELCQWLEYNLTDTDLVPIHISRRTTHIGEIARVLSYHLPKDSEFTWKGNFLNLNNIPLSTLSNYLSTSANIRALSQPGVSELERNTWNKLLIDEKFKNQLAIQLVQFNKSYQNPDRDRSDIDPLPKEEYDLLINELINDSINHLPKNHYKLLREWLLNAIRDLLQIGSLNQILEQVSLYYSSQKKRPVLILEDITSFGFLRDDLFDYLFDLSSGHFDAIIGLTSGFERTQLNSVLSEDDLTYLYERLSGRFILTGENGDTFFLNGNGPARLVKKYLDAIKKNNIPEEWENVCQGLYPLNEELVQRLYTHLVEEGNAKQTPRLLLNFVLRGLLLSEDKPYTYLSKQNPYLIPPTNHFRISDVNDSNLSQLLLWYGKHEKEQITLPKSIADIWDINVPEHLISEDGSTIVLSRLKVQTTPPNPFIKPEERVTPDAWELSLGELQKWLIDDQRYPSRENLKRGIEKFSDNFMESRQIGNSECIASTADNIFYTRSKEHLPIFLSGNSGDAEQKDGVVQLVIGKENSPRYILEELLLYYWKPNNELDMFSNPASTLDWLSNNLNIFQNDIRALLERKIGNIKWEDFVMTAWLLVKNLIDGTAINEQSDLLQRLPFSFNINDNKVNPWVTDSRYHSYYQTYKSSKILMDQWKVYQELMTGLFYLRDGFIDRESYEEFHANFKIYEIIEKLANLDTKELRTLSFRSNKSNITIYQLVEPVHQYCLGLQKLSVKEHSDKLISELKLLDKSLSYQEDLNKSELIIQFSRLKKYYGKLNLSWPISLDNVPNLIEILDLKELGELQDQLKTILNNKKLKNVQDPLNFSTLFHLYSSIMSHPLSQINLLIEQSCNNLTKQAKSSYKCYKSRNISLTNPYKELKSNLSKLEKVLNNEFSRKN
jgi:hypothetical protein